MRLARAVALVLALLALTGVARADDLRPGYLELTQTSAATWRMVWKAPIRGGLATHAAPTLQADCRAPPPVRTLVSGAVVEVWSLDCPRGLAGRSVGLSGLDAAFSDALVRIAPQGRPVQVARLTADQPAVEIRAVPDRLQVARTYLVLGIEHILAGYDHLLFVLSLVLLLRGGLRIAKTVTAFTIAHSLTLVATSLHLISVPRQPVEICIALSIVFLAVEILKSRPEGPPRLSERAPWLVAFAFGLLHGFGFAGALAEIGMPEREVPTALLTFNIGVEIGQLVIVGAGLLVLDLIRRFAPERRRMAQRVAAYGIGITAAYWVFERLLA
ncbi:HupE/UreJ family protein [Caulobacter henricii]|uniref:HupE / UreJ protein n=1 Tax=Caulobacter henricii TaxID=69395 RepID=A0A0P0P104_9CAUL|nr:HupE/UreJ family protein [Caulobacter henricii]ALL14109.1 hypothetical protein AQ619_12595 [Caulobacter henricii]